MYETLSYLSDPLWLRIAGYRFDEPGASFPFTQKLSAQQHWDIAFTLKAIEEYRKFMYLCCILPGGASPSPVVDEVWHLHLTYTVDYWKRFCNETLQQEVHHHPSKGGTDEKRKHNDWYGQTLEQYRKIFGAEPPADVWPVSATEPEALNINPEPLSSSELEKTSRTGLYLLLIPFLFIWGCYRAANPFGLNGPHFLQFYGFLAVMCLLQIIIAQNGKRKRLKLILKTQLDSADVCDLVWLAGGTKSLLVYLIGSMINSGQLELTEDGSYFIRKDLLNKVNHDLFGDYNRSTISMDELKTLFSGTVYARENRFGALKDAYTDWVCTAIVPAIVFLTGVARLIQGASNDRPVGWLFLEILLFVAVYFGFVIYYGFHNVNELIFRTNTDFTEHVTEDFSRRVIFSGATAVLSAPLLWHLSREFNVTDNNSGSSCGSGSSCSGGSSCGSGCGSSGCGGCSGN